MCGIVGFLGSAGSAGQDAAAVRRMADLIRHRGPDDDGVWADAEAGVALAQRRLAIIDFVPRGASADALVVQALRHGVQWRNL